MTHGSICSGVGGLDLAVNKVFGTQTSWLTEFDQRASKVLEERFPGVPNLGDLTKINWHEVEPVKVMSGGTPCQDLSQAGKRAGMREGTRSGLWESMREGIAVLRPQYVVWENVKGALSAKASSDVERTEGRVGGLRALGRVLGDLSSLGYDARWGVVRASDAGLAHRRERVFVLASADPDSFEVEFGQDLGCLAHEGVPTQEGQSATLPLSRPGDADHADQGGVAGDLVRYRSYAEAIERQAGLYGPPPEPLTPEDDLNPQFTEWIMGFPVGWASEVAGLTDEDVRKMMGNAVAPPQGELALRLLLS